jgi:hypothetical protein
MQQGESNIIDPDVSQNSMVQTQQLPQGQPRFEDEIMPNPSHEDFPRQEPEDGKQEKQFLKTRWNPFM